MRISVEAKYYHSPAYPLAWRLKKFFWCHGFGCWFNLTGISLQEEFLLKDMRMRWELMKSIVHNSRRRPAGHEDKPLARGEMVL
jgi:hypothetical protein